VPPSANRDGDQHYDVISAVHQFMRGSDVDAARALPGAGYRGGRDPGCIARRLIVHSREDVHWPIRPRFKTAVPPRTRSSSVGLPERGQPGPGGPSHRARAESTRSSRRDRRAMPYVNSGRSARCPSHLRDAHYLVASASDGQATSTPHDLPEGIVHTQHRPDVTRRARVLEPQP